MKVQASSFRIGLLMIGATGVVATALLSDLSAVAILCGISFGAGGWLLDYYVTDFRQLFGAQLSNWALVAGGIVVLLSMGGDIRDGTIGWAYYTIPVQYVSVVYMCWGLLMFVMSVHQHEP
jgi:hypothetical protein